jgi:hypothetical protein
MRNIAMGIPRSAAVRHLFTELEMRVDFTIPEIRITGDKSDLNSVGCNIYIYTSSPSLSVLALSEIGHATAIIVKQRRKSPANLHSVKEDKVNIGNGR